MAVFPAVFGLLMAAFVSGQNVEIKPREVVRRVGDSLDVLCKVPYPIDSCRMAVGSTTYRLLPETMEGDVVYSGQGLQFGECGATIKNVKEEWNGNISCVLPPQSGNIEIKGTMRLLVARAPERPVLVSPRQGYFEEGESFMAQCIVPKGRPAARITWYLDAEQVTTGVHQPIVSSVPGSDLETISQNISRTLSVDDDTKELVCKVEHEALDQPLSSKIQLSIRYPPKRLEAGTITIFGLKLGEVGRLNVTVRANPAPQAEWTVADRKLVAYQHSDDGAFTALEPLNLGKGFYNVTLVISRITKEDVDRMYYLRVSNDFGQEDFTVKISTMPEPTGVELGTGAIIGIVVAVLIMLVAISLGVFAFATDRWCFAGQKRNNVKSSGESTAAGDVLLDSGNPLPRTDTESAVGGRERSRLAGLGARMMAALPRAKDKVQATESQAADNEDKPLSEEKKGVVYAELALGDQNADKPPPPSTEYAEIVYTDQPTKEAETKQ